MDFAEFLRSIDSRELPADLGAPLAALWHARQGDWNTAHEIVQDESDRRSAWVHAYLHRVEGDRSNAAYWYRSAGQKVCSTSLDEEWESISRSLLAELRSK